MEDNTHWSRAEWQGLAAALAPLTDQRQKRGIRYALPGLLILLLLAKLAGEDTPTEIAQWVAERQALLTESLGLSWQKMPHAATWRRLWQSGLKVSEVEAVAGQWLRSLTHQSARFHLDGKTLRGTIPAQATAGLHLLSLYEESVGVPLQQVAVDQKENEISAAPRVLAAEELAGKTVTGDALLAQQSLSRQILAGGGDYCWTIKKNQPMTRQAIADLFLAESLRPGPVTHDFQTVTTVEKGHGRLEERTLISSALLNDYLDWPGVQQVFQITRQRTQLNTGKQTCETVQGLTSLPPTRANAAQLLEIVRSHWSIENGLHYVRDVTFQEDRCRLKSKTAGEVLAVINNLVIGLLRHAGWDNLAAARRHFAAHLPAALNLVCGFA